MRSPLATAAMCLVMPLFAAGIAASPAVAQAVRVSIDTTKLDADSRSAVRTMTAYLTSRRGLYSANADTPSPLWSADEQRKWPLFDLASAYMGDGVDADVARIESVSTAGQREYRITTRFTSRTRAEGVEAWYNNVAMTVFAAQQDGRWVLSNALPRNTAAWKRETVGNLEYVIAPGITFNRVRAESASAFVDSLADMMSVPRIERHSYYMLNSLDDAYAVLGLVSDVKFGPGAFAQPVNRQLFAGVPAVGENYRHELAHLVLRPLMTNATSTFVSEGVPTWLGGTTGMDHRTTVAGLATWLNAHPQVTLDSLMRPGYPHPQVYAAAAVVTEMVFDVGGRHGVKLMFDAGGSPSELREGLQRITKFGWSRMQQEWRERVRDYEKKDHQQQ